MGLNRKALNVLAGAKRELETVLSKGARFHQAYTRYRIRRALEWRPAETGTGPEEFLPPRTDPQGGGSGRQAPFSAQELLVSFQHRGAPSFFFEPEEAEGIAALVEPREQEMTLRTADDICGNLFRFRGTEVRFPEEVDWFHSPEGNSDWSWDLNRHTVFETLGRAWHYSGDPRYVRKFRELATHWLELNWPGRDQRNWASPFEVAFRVNSWAWAWGYFRSCPHLEELFWSAFLKGFFLHGKHLAAHLELHVRNNHLLLEAKSLVMAGLLFNGLEPAQQWKRRGLAALFGQMKEQVCADGVHAERSSHYHKVISGELLELAVLMERLKEPMPREYLERIRRMVDYEICLIKPDGLIPLLGDSALGDTHHRFNAAVAGPLFLRDEGLRRSAPDESTVWLLGPRLAERLPSLEQPPVPASREFPDGGYFIMRGGRAGDSSYLVFDCGPFGHDPKPGHGHADALSFELFAGGQTMLVDPGVYSTHLGQEWRNYFRGTRAHNTVVVDGQDQTELHLIWGVRNRAKSVLHEWMSSGELDFVDGAHFGYCRLQEPVVHRRQLLFIKPFEGVNYWVVVDTLEGRGEHTFDLLFHAAPGTAVSGSHDSILLSGNRGRGLRVIACHPQGTTLEVIEGATDPIQGWVSTYSGEKEASPVLCYRLQCPVPVRFVTLLIPAGAGDSPPEIRPVLAGSTPGEPLLLDVGFDGYRDLLLIDPNGGGREKRIGEFTTEGRFLVRRQRLPDQTVVMSRILGDATVWR
jgi:hypothetical protein